MQGYIFFYFMTDSQLTLTNIEKCVKISLDDNLNNSPRLLQVKLIKFLITCEFTIMLCRCTLKCKGEGIGAISYSITSGKETSSSLNQQLGKYLCHSNCSFIHCGYSMVHAVLGKDYK